MLKLGIKEIRERAAESKYRDHPFVNRIWNLIHDLELFSMGADELAALRQGLMRDSLAFFRDNSEYYASLFKRSGIEPTTAERKDLIKLLVPADATWRWT